MQKKNQPQTTNKFQGDEGRSRLISALRSQHIVQDDEQCANDLVQLVEVEAYELGESVITQDGVDDDLYFILSGSFSVQVHGREVAIRRHGQHVGEMCMIDSCTKRSATVVALEPSVVAKISEANFVQVADRYPRIWQRLAREICNRLRQRNELVRPKNSRPVLFIASSVEGLPVAQAMQTALFHDNIKVVLWTNQVFGGSNFTIEDLEREVESADFAAVVVSPDDEVISRETKSEAPRDNVVFELGLFMGALTRKRTFLVCPNAVDMKIPSDLIGLNPLKYKTNEDEELATRVSVLCNELRTTIKTAGVR